MELIKITKESKIPLIGTIAFGIIDRGSNLIQIRPTTLCNLQCIFCSTAANDPKIHQINYEIEVGYLLEWIKEIVEFKGNNVEANIDSVGEALCYKDIIKLIDGIKKINGISKISMQSNGTLLTKEKIKELEEAGLNKINLSLHSLNDEKNKFLTGCQTYNTKHILEVAELISKSKIELLLAPVFISKLNNKDIEDLIELSKKLKCKIGIQKYEIHKYGRKVKKIKEITFWKFYKKLEEWEKKFNVKLKLGPYDFNIKRTKRIPKVFSKNEIVNAEIKIPGWIKNELIGVAKNRCVTIINCNAKIGQRIKAKIIDDKNEIYIAKSL